MAHPRLKPGLLDESEWDVVDYWLTTSWNNHDFSCGEWNEVEEDPDDEEEMEEIPPTLTERTAIGGWAAKWRPDEFASITKGIVPAFSQENSIGLADGDDCMIVRVNDKQAIVFSMDWFPPVVDDPYQFGAISAAGALSNLYAAGVKPMTALNMMALPCKLGIDEVGAVMRGGSDKVIEAGAFVVGGHSIDDADPKYGLAVFGMAPTESIIRNENVCPGDILFYTKPLGSGILAAAFKAYEETAETLEAAIDSMMELNKAAFDAAAGINVHGAASVNATGLVGRLHAMMESCEASATLEWDQIPLFDRVWDYACAGTRPNRTESVVEWAKAFVEQGTMDDTTYANRMTVLCDPQTSGGLIMAVAPEDADRFSDEFFGITGRRPARIGKVCDGNVGVISVE